ncbi:MAG: carbohydrate kinase family protein [Caldisericia bacterium]|nr:carbohydrate kinase family protein [Caldisericia bacterium]
MEKEKNVLVLGDNCIDIRIKIKKVSFKFEYDENSHVKELKIVPAGTGVNFSVALSKLGIKTYYLSSLSRDLFGKIIFDYLIENSVKTDLITFSNKNTASIVIVLNKNGERISFANLKNASYVDTDFNKIDLINLDKFSVIYISGGLLTEKNLNERTFNFLNSTKEKIKIFFDINYRIGKDIKYFKDYAFKIFDISHFIFTNEYELSIIKKENFNKAISEGKIFIVKMGERGAKIIFKNGEIFEPSFKVRSIDTTGAGDVFNAAFIFSYLNGFDFKKSLFFSNLVASLSTTKIGIYIPKKDLLNKYLKRGGYNA